MPSNAETHRGTRRNFKILQEPFDTSPDRQVDIKTIMDPVELMELLADLLAEGHALTISRTKDGGALCLGFFVGRKAIKRYIASKAEWDRLVEELAD